MAANWMRRSFVAAACAATALLAACGSSSIDSAIAPTRIIAFGDAMADVGQKGSGYTVNDGSLFNWTQQLASHYGLVLKPVSAGGTSYAQGNARISATPDAAGNAGTPTVKQQIDQFLANPQFKADDVILISAGASDIIAGMAAVQAAAQTEAQYVAATGQAGNAPVSSADSADYQALAAALQSLSIELAQAIVRDGEGATKFMTITVEGGRSREECKAIGYAIARSPLVKTAFFASDPNLGRILAAIGYAGIDDLDVDQLSLYLDDVLVAVNGGRNPAYQEEDGQQVMNKAEILVRVVLGRGDASATVWTCDFSYDYVRINADYRS